eukprot:TRINITY_DN24033_c0_g1_i2.p1 TRINITY_DN24033_c0_g1~~TRINITY_DN24033_c0_g1_i2.p1  ORF type:complete len:404 (-),score=84.10 TRINITY_DN24033_c0_g1_i2:37-1248(-)
MKLQTAAAVFLVVFSLLTVVTSAKCSQDSDCPGIFYCSQQQGQCMERTVNTNWGWQLAVATLILCLAAVISAAAGLGGGGVFVPLFIMVMGMSPQQAVPVSQATIFAGSIINMIFNSKSKHSILKRHPLIDFDTLLVMCPMLLAGTIIGVILNSIFPSWLLVVLLVITLTYTSYKTSLKAIAAWKGETKHARLTSTVSTRSPTVENIQAANSSVDNDTRSVQAPSAVEGPTGVSVVEQVGELEQKKEELDALVQNEISPTKQIILMTLMWVVVLVMSLLRGGRTSGSIANVQFCSSAYWAIVVILLMFLVAFGLSLSHRLFANIQKKRSLGWEPGRGEVKWTQKTVYVYPMMSGFAGLLGGLLGLGGGMILGPIFLEIGMESRATSATSATAVVSFSIFYMCV